MGTCTERKVEELNAWKGCRGLFVVSVFMCCMTMGARPVGHRCRIIPGTATHA